MNNQTRPITFKSKLLKESYRKYSHRSGLDIYIFPKKMTSTYAVFGTKYGSLNNSFYDTASNSLLTVPDGIAHFLEHKLFACEDGSDAFERFSEYGADANAYTSFNKTCYLFSSTDRFEDSLAELLDFVTHPYFTNESVASEVGIIAEEIKMYDDTPSDRCFYGMLEGMYENHPIKRNICGSAESISKITPELLYKCYDTFYTLDNMALVICGDVSDDTVLSIANKILPSTPSKRSSPVFPNDNDLESPRSLKSIVETKMQVSKPIFNIGFKDVDIPSDANERQRKDAAMAILDEMIFSRAGALYNDLLEKDMISPALSYGYSISKTAAYNSIAGESDDPHAVYNAILSHIQKIALDGLIYEDFLRGKRVMYSEFVRSFDSTDSIANNLFSFICEDAELLSYADILESVTFEDVKALFKKAFDERSATLSVVLPINTQAT